MKDLATSLWLTIHYESRLSISSAGSERHFFHVNRLVSEKNIRLVEHIFCELIFVSFFMSDFSSYHFIVTLSEKKLQLESAHNLDSYPQLNRTCDDS